MFAGRFQYSGKDFLCHNVGTASILCFLDQPSEIVAAGLIHNAYGNGIFRFINGSISKKRNFIKKELGKNVEQYIYGFHKINFNYETGWIKTYLENPQSILPASQIEKDTLLIQLADMLEHSIDRGILYSNFSEEKISFVKDKGEAMIKMAEILGYPLLAAELKVILNNSLKLNISRSLKVKEFTQWSSLTIPRSYKKRNLISLADNLYNNVQMFKKFIYSNLRKKKRRIRKIFTNSSQRFR